MQRSSRFDIFDEQQTNMLKLISGERAWLTFGQQLSRAMTLEAKVLSAIEVAAHQ
jgi:hypothetical protein